MGLVHFYEAKSQFQRQLPQENEEPLLPCLSKVSPTIKTIYQETYTYLTQREAGQGFVL